MPFRFRQFTLEDDRSTMRTGTDAILLGSWTDPRNARRILDIGTGSGILALMLAQRSDASIDAIDVDPASIEQARDNFRNSPWNDRLHAILISFADHYPTPLQKYDLIITNPPFFKDSLASPDMRRNLARHDDRLSLEEIASGSVQILSETGNLFIILPAAIQGRFMAIAEKPGLFPQEVLEIKPKRNKKVNRVILKMGKGKPGTISSSELVIRKEDNSFTEQYLSLTGEYHFFSI
jgi:tRNA1Val (adenine37-N6)-methyltransferase